MKRRHPLLTVLKIGMTLLCFYIVCCLFIYTMNQSRSGKTVRNEMDFYRALLYAKADATRIPIDTLVPVEWDHMKVFPTYATRGNKIKYAGYQYADDLDSMEHEDIVSLLFTKGDYVVYYVDILVPRLFKFENLPNGLAKMSCQGGGWYSVDIDQHIVPDFTEWAYFPKIEEAARTENPYFEISRRSSDKIGLTLDCEH